MATIDVTAESLAETLSANDTVLLDFWAGWCGPCRAFAPVFQDVSNAHPDVVFGKVDTESEQTLAASARISSIPTLMAFRGGVLVFSQAGALSAAALENLLASVKALDIDDLRLHREEVAATETVKGGALS